MNTNEFLANLAILGLRTGSMAHRDHRIPLTEIIVLALLYKYKSLTSEDALVTIERVTDAIGSTVDIHGANSLNTSDIKNIIQHLRNTIPYSRTSVGTQKVRGVVHYQVLDATELEKAIGWMLQTIPHSGDVIWVTFMKVVDEL